MNNQDQTISSKSYGWIILAWLASLSALPVCFSILYPEPMSPFGLRLITRELMMLTVPPGIAVVALFKAFRQTRFTAGRLVLLIIPAGLSLMELGFAFLYSRAM